MHRNSFIFILIPLFFACTGKKENVDFLIYNATIYAVDSSFHMYESMAVKDGKVVELGTNLEMFEKYYAIKMEDAQGKFVYPGFIDAHCHFLGYGLGLVRVNLVGTKSLSEVRFRVDKFVNGNLSNKDEPVSPGLKNPLTNEWVVGRGWDQNDWDNKAMPDNKRLDSLFPDRPVFLARIDGHAALVNSVALKMAGITANTKISGGEILTENNKPTGVLIDNAVDLVKKIIPMVSNEEKTVALFNAQQNCLAMGITTVDDAGLMKEDIEIIDQAQKSGKLKIRVYAMLSDSAPNYRHYLKTGPYKTERLNVRAFKFYADGALGSRGACLKDDYNDKKNWRGFLLSEQKHFEEKALTLASTNFQMATHCIGDSAYKIILNAYRKAGAGKEKRWRIEHAQVVNPREMKESDNIIPSVQPTHATSDMYWIKERLGGTRSRHAYAYKDLLKTAGLVALGTDFPVEDISPFKTFYAAVARQDAKGFPEKGFQTENALTREETLRGMTIWAAYSNFEEHEKGSLEKGKLADFIILDKDLMKCNLSEVTGCRVIATYIYGELVFSVTK